MSRFAIVVVAIGISAAGILAAPSLPSDVRAIEHALNRLTFGPRPGEVDRVRALGLSAWLDRQLNPKSIDDRELSTRLDRFETLSLDSSEIALQYFIPARQNRLALQRAGGQDAVMPEPADTPPGPDQRMPPNGLPPGAARGRLPLRELSEAKVLRAVYSDHELEEVLVDFWFNHFNVFAGKGRTFVYLTEYERDAIRPRVFGKFRDLLGATAKSPAMLFYLDNWMSADPNATASRQMLRRPGAGQQPGPGQRPGLLRRPGLGAGPAPAQRPDPDTATPQRQPRGLNENYGRELLELHTLGVDGGYTQADVIEVARAFTGWTIGPLQMDGFRFAPALHDRGVKHVLGHTIKAKGGIEDGEQVLDILATHPATARHIALALARRFVSDTPPPALVERAARKFRDTDGNLREVVRLIVTSPEFFAPEAQRAKVKTPIEFVVSALRTSGADVRTAAASLRTLQQLGMMPYMCQPPTGYEDTADAWVSSGGLVTRMNFASQLASGRMPGIVLPPDAPRDLAMRLGSPEFQRR